MSKKCELFSPVAIFTLSQAPRPAAVAGVNSQNTDKDMIKNNTDSYLLSMWFLQTYIPWVFFQPIMQCYFHLKNLKQHIFIPMHLTA